MKSCSNAGFFFAILKNFKPALTLLNDKIFCKYILLLYVVFKRAEYYFYYTEIDNKKGKIICFSNRLVIYKIN